MPEMLEAGWGVGMFGKALCLQEMLSPTLLLPDRKQVRQGKSAYPKDPEKTRQSRLGECNRLLVPKT